MDTKYLDEELEKLNLWDKKGELSEFGKEKLNEFRAIKQALNLHDVSVSIFLMYEHMEKPLEESREVIKVWKSRKDAMLWIAQTKDPKKYYIEEYKINSR